ncbi:ubiquitin-conjugating enzyme E2-like, partial [Haematococcus lacustris]
MTGMSSLVYDGANGGWSPALTISKVALSLRSMLASNTEYSRPAGDRDYCMSVGSRSPKQLSSKATKDPGSGSGA